MNGWPQGLLERVEDAGLNAAAPPQQRWFDGWLVRYSPGKAKRARCINPVAAGRRSLDERLAYAAALYAAQGLPLLVRITPFVQPPDLPGLLQARGLQPLDDTRVMVLPSLARTASPALPPHTRLETLGHEAFAQAVGALRGTPLAQRLAHAQRLAQSPVPYEGWVLRDADGAVAACAQMAQEGPLAGLYDVFTQPAWRGRGLARQLCAHLLARARERGAEAAYLQVEADNEVARRVYRRMGFADGYAYHYLAAQAPGDLA